VARRSAVGPAGLSGEVTVELHALTLLQVAAVPAWVGPTMALSLAIIALSILGTAVALAVLAVRLSGQAEKLGASVGGLQDDVAQTLKALRRLTEQAQDVMVLVRHEAGAFAQTSRRVRRKVVRGVDRIEETLTDLETLYDVVHGEVEDAALDVASTLRSIRRGNGMLGRVRRLLVAGRS
jgi:ABC-type transporter Mla subunit MlaD